MNTFKKILLRVKIVILNWKVFVTVLCVYYYLINLMMTFVDGDYITLFSLGWIFCLFILNQDEIFKKLKHSNSSKV